MCSLQLRTLCHSMYLHPTACILHTCKRCICIQCENTYDVYVRTIFTESLNILANSILLPISILSLQQRESFCSKFTEV